MNRVGSLPALGTVAVPPDAEAAEDPGCVESTDDAVAADGDVALGDLAGDDIQEAPVLQDEIGLGPAQALVDDGLDLLALRRHRRFLFRGLSGSQLTTAIRRGLCALRWPAARSPAAIATSGTPPQAHPP